jgi:hypothetical protein
MGRVESSRIGSYVTTDGQSASLSWNRTLIWGLRPDLYYFQTVSGLLMWGALSDERTGLSFTIAAGPRQQQVILRSESRVYPLLGKGSVNTFPQKQTRGAIGRLLLGNGPVTTHSWQVKTVFSVRSVPKSYNRAQSEDESEYRTTEELKWIESSEFAAAGNGKQGIRRYKGDFTCDLKLQWDCDKSVARMRMKRWTGKCVE